MTLQPRKIRSSDLDGFHALFSDVAAEGLFSTRPCAPPKAVIGRALEKAEASGWAVYVIEHEGRIIASAEAYPDNFCRPDGDASVGILGMQVQRQWRRQGLGRMLLETLIGHCREQGMSRIELNVFKSNHAALALYEHFGFEWVADLPVCQMPAGHQDQPQRMRLLLARFDSVMLP